MSISVIIPVFNGERTLPQVLAALACASPPADEILVVDDGSNDDSAAIASKAGCRVIRLDSNAGAAVAKNRGAAAAGSSLLYFTDDDVVVPPDIFLRLNHAFLDDTCDAVVGLLDPRTSASGFASQFKNLWMNFTYARFAGRDRIGLFYTSTAAIRGACFQQLGGFDEKYRGASIAEDTEFGQRAWAHGARIRLEPAMRVTHLKTYTLAGLLREDFLRAAALTRMRLRKFGQPFFTSVPLFFQIAVPVFWLILLLLVLSVAIWVVGSSWVTFAFLVPVLSLSVGLLIFFFALNASLLLFLFRMRGLWFAIQGCLFLPLDALAVGSGMMSAALDLARNKRY